MPNNRASCWARLCDNEKLGHIDEYGKKAGLEQLAIGASYDAMEQIIYAYHSNQHPATERNVCDYGKSVHEGDEIEEQESR